MPDLSPYEPPKSESTRQKTDAEPWYSEALAWCVASLFAMIGAAIDYYRLGELWEREPFSCWLSMTAATISGCLAGLGVVLFCSSFKSSPNVRLQPGHWLASLMVIGFSSNLFICYIMWIGGGRIYTMHQYPWLGILIVPLLLLLVISRRIAERLWKIAFGLEAIRHLCLSLLLFAGWTIFPRLVQFPVFMALLVFQSVLGLFAAIVTDIAEKRPRDRLHYASAAGWIVNSLVWILFILE